MSSWCIFVKSVTLTSFQSKVFPWSTRSYRCQWYRRLVTASDSVVASKRTPSDGFIEAPQFLLHLPPKRDYRLNVKRFSLSHYKWSCNQIKPISFCTFLSITKKKPLLGDKQSNITLIVTFPKPTSLRTNSYNQIAVKRLKKRQIKLMWSYIVHDLYSMFSQRTILLRRVQRPTNHNKCILNDISLQWIISRPSVVNDTGLKKNCSSHRNSLPT